MKDKKEQEDKKEQGDGRRIYVMKISNLSESTSEKETMSPQLESYSEEIRELEEDPQEMRSSSGNYFVKLLQSELKQSLSPLISELRTEVPQVVAIYSRELVKEIWTGFLESLGIVLEKESKKESS